MRFNQYISESVTGPIIVDTLRKECAPYISAVKNCKYKFLYRGTHEQPIGAMHFVKTRTNRKPKDTPWESHNYFDKLFEERFGWKARSGGVFAAANFSDAASYSFKGVKPGVTSLFFPIGKFKYVWSPQVADFYNFARYLFPNFIDSTIGKVEDFKINHFKESAKQIYYTISYYTGYDKIESMSDITKMSEIVAQDLVDTYKDNDICEFFFISKDRGNEISVKCNSYYMIDTSVEEYILKELF
jgi:hypothetical protein